MKKVNLIKAYAQSFKDNFELPALTNYTDRFSYTFGELACEIDRLHRLFDILGLQSGDHIALLGKDSAQWSSVFMATITKGLVIVPILSDFNSKDAAHIVKHSDSKVLFMDKDMIADELLPSISDQLSTVVEISTRELLYNHDEALNVQITSLLQSDFESTYYPNGFQPSDINYPEVSNDQLMILNYTSGTTGYSKGVMLTGQNIVGNAIYAHSLNVMFRGEQIVCFLPLAHAYSCAFNLLTPLSIGTHVYILGKVPSPKILLKAMDEVKPVLIISVPLILEKIYSQAIVPVMDKSAVKFINAIPGVRQILYSVVRKKLCQALGGNFREVIVGGAALTPEVGTFLKKVGFPLTVGYGMTECAPLISYESHRTWKDGSCGKILSVMEARIAPVEDLEVPLAEGVGEVQVRGMNVCQGYYKLPEINATLFTADGWMRTGDLGTLDKQGNLYLKGRSKTMILRANGQNIYPEEIEAKISMHPFINESIVVDRKGRLEAIVHPNAEAIRAAGLSEEEGWEQIIAFRKELNNATGGYEKVTRFDKRDTPFEKTPKHSIKRYLYK